MEQRATPVATFGNERKKNKAFNSSNTADHKTAAQKTKRPISLALHLLVFQHRSCRQPAGVLLFPKFSGAQRSLGKLLPRATRSTSKSPHFSLSASRQILLLSHGAQALPFPSLLQSNQANGQWHCGG